MYSQSILKQIVFHVNRFLSKKQQQKTNYILNEENIIKCNQCLKCVNKTCFFLIRANGRDINTYPLKIY